MNGNDKVPLLDPAKREQSWGQRLKSSYSFKNNAKTLFSGSNARYGVLDGVRSLSVLWVLLVHSFVNYPVPNNQLNNSFWVRFIANGVYGVDSFFVLSGFLMYLYLWFLGKGTINVPRFYLRRWLRLSPAYFLCLAIFWAVSAKINQTQNEYCIKYWWSNLLFINNFIGANVQCFYWSWSIAVEMHFYLLSPIFLYFVHKNRQTGRRIIWGVIIFTTLIRLLLTVYVGVIINNDDDWVQYVYLTPWCRIGPFLIGMLTSMNIEDKEYQKFDLQNEPEPVSRTSEAYFWISCVVLFVTGGIWSSHVNDPIWSVGPCLVFGNLIIGGTVAYIIYYLLVFATEKNWLKRFLCCRPFGIIAQLSYGMYLTSPMLQIFMYEIHGYPLLSFGVAIGAWLFFSALAVVAAIVLYFVIEKPMMTIVR